MMSLKVIVLAALVASVVSTEEKRSFLDTASVLAGRLWSPVVGGGATGAACRNYGYCNNPSKDECKQGGGGAIADIAGSIYANTVGNAAMTDSMKKASCIDLGFYLEPQNVGGGYPQTGGALPPVYLYDPPTFVPY